MATVELENIIGFVDKRRTRGQSTDNVTTPANFADEASLDARLIAINSGYYTSRVDKMTKNDKVYAVRLNDEAGGF